MSANRIVTRVNCDTGIFCPGRRKSVIQISGNPLLLAQLYPWSLANRPAYGAFCCSNSPTVTRALVQVA